MKNVVWPALGIMVFLFLVNWGTPETNTDGTPKSSISFYGSLETWQGKYYPTIENILIDRTRQLVLYEKPDSSIQLIPGQQDYQLTQNPSRDFLKVKLDLHEIYSLEIPEPEHPWSYKRKKNGHDTEYLEIIVTSRDAQHTKTSYLIESRKKIYGDLVIVAGQSVEECEVPISAVKKLSIVGFKYCQATKTPCIPLEDHPLVAPPTPPVA